MISNFYGSWLTILLLKISNSPFLIIKSVQRYKFFSTYASARAFFLYFPLFLCFFVWSNIKRQISNVKYQMSNIKYQFISPFITSEFYSDIGSADFFVHYVGILFRHRLCRLLPSSPVLRSPLSPPPIFFSPSERGLGGVLPPFLVVPPDLIRLSSSCIFVPSLGQPLCSPLTCIGHASAQHRSNIGPVSYPTAPYIYIVYIPWFWKQITKPVLSSPFPPFVRKKVEIFAYMQKM